MQNTEDFKVRYGPSGLHLFHRKSGFNFLLDEIAVPERLWTTAPRQVSIALTNACDLHCPYCYAPKHRAVLSFQKILEWIDELDANGTLGVGFGGGEPTLYRGFADLCCYLGKHNRVAISFTTHAHHLSDQLLRKIQDHVHFVRVSVDGVGSTYERMRRRSFAVLRQRLAAVGAALPFGINYVVNSDTIVDLDAAISLACEFKASEFLLLPERPTSTRAGISHKEMLALKRWFRKFTGAIRLAISESDSQLLPTCDPLLREPGLRAYAHIDAQGVLKRNSYDRSGIAIGGDGVLAALGRLRQQEKQQHENME